MGNVPTPSSPNEQMNQLLTAAQSVTSIRAGSTLERILQMYAQKSITFRNSTDSLTPVSNHTSMEHCVDMGTGRTKSEECKSREREVDLDGNQRIGETTNRGANQDSILKSNQIWNQDSSQISLETKGVGDNPKIANNLLATDAKNESTRIYASIPETDISNVNQKSESSIYQENAACKMEKKESEQERGKSILKLHGKGAAAIAGSMRMHSSLQNLAIGEIC